jgi:hypothetical protein
MQLEGVKSFRASKITPLVSCAQMLMMMRRIQACAQILIMFILYVACEHDAQRRVWRRKIHACMRHVCIMRKHVSLPRQHHVDARGRATSNG